MKYTRLAGCEIKRIRPIFKTEMLIFQSKTNLDEKILFDATYLPKKSLKNQRL